MLKPLFNLSVAVLNSYVLWYDQKYVDIPFPGKEMAKLPFKGRVMFLTMWCLVLQTVYHFVAAVCDILEENSSKNRNTLHRVRDALFSVAFPIALYVSITFWAIYLIDRNLIFPEHFDKIYPPFFNHVMHTTVALFMFVELFITYREYPKRVTGYFAITSVIISYAVWFFYIYATCNAWVYPFFDQLNWPQRILFTTTSVVTAPIFYVAGEKLNELVCPKLKKDAKNGVSKKKSKNS